MRHEPNSEPTERQQVLRKRLDTLEIADAPWPQLRAVKSAYLKSKRADALAIRATQEQSTAPVTLAEIERLAAVMAEAQERNEATANVNDYFTYVDSIDAAVAEEIAESNFEIATARHREAHGEAL
jgi:hypothetical protein